MTAIALAARGVSLVALFVALVIAVTFYLVRSRRIGPFGWWARTVRRAADPLLRPIEARLARAGRNPQDAPAWLLGFAVTGGLLLISLVDWLLGFASEARMAASGGGAGVAVFLINGVYTVLLAALIVRVVASWFGIGAYDRRFRPVILLTEWLLAPIRRFVPPVGMVDLSPMVAWIILVVLHTVLLGLVR
jgi:YggT family protein